MTKQVVRWIMYVFGVTVAIASSILTGHAVHQELFPVRPPETTSAADQPRTQKSLSECDRQFRSQSYDRCIELASSCILSMPHDSRAYLIRGYAHLNKNAFDLAIQDFTKVLEIDPADSYALAGRGFAFYYSGNSEMAIADLSEVTPRHPNHSALIALRAEAYALAGRWADAESDFNAAIKLSPLNTELIINRAVGVPLYRTIR